MHFLSLSLSSSSPMTTAVEANAMFASDPALTACIALACQSFFAWRVYRLMHAWWAPALIVLVGFASFLGAIGTTVGVEIVKLFAEFQKFQVVVIIWLACAALADLMITLALVWTLQKSRTGFAPTDDVITRLIRVTLQTGMATSVFAILDLITFCASDSTLHLVFNLPLAKLYTNSLLSTLNARALMANQINQRRHTMQPDGSSGGAMSKDILSGANHTNRIGSRQMRWSPSAEADAPSPTRGKGGFFSTFVAGNGNSGNVGLNSMTRGGRLDLDQGIQVTTIEERYEEPSNSTVMASYPHRPHQPRSFPHSQESVAADPEYYGADLSRDGISQENLRPTAL